ncbi:MAG TPA: hypothetical protein VN673_15175 [Clostridia bacterium]|nr:hypothetical protein [Clostridia bacterium]
MFKIFLAAGLFALTGCRTVAPFPPADVTAPGWTLRQGQAVWATGRGEISGEVLLATRSHDRWLLQFSKPPFTILTAQIADNSWQIEFPPEGKRYSGRGTPPKRLPWVRLPGLLAGEPPPRGWTWETNGGNWRLANPRRGTAIEGYFEPTNP